MENIKYATGKRKTSIAKVWLSKGSGKIMVNGKDFKDYFKRSNHQMQIQRPFEIINQQTDYDVKCKVSGGGLTGQAGAIRLGISRALNTINEDYRKIIKEKGFLTRDSRKVERKKPGQPGARKNFQFSKR